MTRKEGKSLESDQTIEDINWIETTMSNFQHFGTRKELARLNMMNGLEEQNWPDNL